MAVGSTIVYRVTRLTAVVPAHFIRLLGNERRENSVFLENNRKFVQVSCTEGRFDTRYTLVITETRNLRCLGRETKT